MVPGLRNSSRTRKEEILLILKILLILSIALGYFVLMAIA